MIYIYYISKSEDQLKNCKKLPFALLNLKKVLSRIENAKGILKKIERGNGRETKKINQ